MLSAWDRIRDILPPLAIITAICALLSIVSEDPNPIVGAVIADIVLIVIFGIEV